ncbi:hypothetical protein B0A52_07726 [Exophiala mesophila]|uniref:J domain-containing protein n=1 Tax=Exophiala mesophila TaxID=212818 RepID=A0A438MVM6_EXOME|nr:hypothetical protein B0A52_07726 [Exophiala mesophila]
MPSTALKKASQPLGHNLRQCCACNSSSPRKRFKAESPAHVRSYADVKSKAYEFRDNMNWPCRAVPFTPSPYDIFDLPKNGIYSKHKFYELVKIYHPDRTGHGCDLPHVERLERYRLVVQAHEILSDPVKRRAFDASGMGWGEKARTASRHSKGFHNAAGKQYGQGPDDDSTIFKNATWEDWERWYQQQDSSQKQQYSGVFLHPNAFASFVIFLAVLSGVLQATRAGQYSGALEEKAKTFTAETSRFLTSRQHHLEQNQYSPDGRVRHFLQKRDPSKSGLKDGEEEVYRQYFPENTEQPGTQRRMGANAED